MSELPIFKRFLSIGNLKSNLRRFFKPKLKAKSLLLKWVPEHPVGGVGRRESVGPAEGGRVEGLERVQPEEGDEEEHRIALRNEMLFGCFEK